VAEHKKEVLNAEEAAQLLEVSVWTIRAAASGGELPAHKVGRAWRFSRQAHLG
jgi:excisionase family DNA binding protein